MSSAVVSVTSLSDGSHRLRDEELVYVLRQLVLLDLDEGIFEASQSEDPESAILALLTSTTEKDISVNGSVTTVVDTALSHLQIGTARSRKAHLFALYPQLLALLSLPQYEHTSSFSRHHTSTPKLGLASALVSGAGAMGKDDDLEDLDFRELSKLCLETIGRDLAGTAT